MNYFESLNQIRLNELISATKKALFICLPSLHKEMADTIIDLKHEDRFPDPDVEIHILIDFDAQTFRQGYGDFEAIDNLIKAGCRIKSLKDIRVSFVISDEVGYYLFIESRSLIPADKETINAVRIDPISMVRLKKYFFEESVLMDFEDELTNAIIEESKRLVHIEETLVSSKIAPEELTLEDIKIVSEELQSNPPLKPDYKRIVEFYANKFQYVKLKFEGSNIQHRKIVIPPSALPIVDANLKHRLETKLNLFDLQQDDGTFALILQLKDKVTAIRENYLTKIKSREESLLNKLRKKDFQAEITALENEIQDVKGKTISLIEQQIANTKAQLLGDLIEFFEVNPKAFDNQQSVQWQDNSDYIKLASKSMAEKIIYRISWPFAHTLVEGFKLEVNFSDITYEDLKSKQFIQELKNYGLIDSEDIDHLATFGLGMEAN